MSKLEPPIADVNASYEREPQQPGWSPAGQDAAINRCWAGPARADMAAAREPRFDETDGCGGSVAVRG